MTLHQEQIKRIKHKLAQAGKADRKYKVFGAERHKYQLHKAASEAEISHFEERFSISLPACYRSFLLNIGNGGPSFAGSAAGPFYGIYPLGSHVNELIPDNVEKYLKNDCLIYPDMSDQYWKTLTEKLDQADTLSELEYEQEEGKLFGGILPLGSQGCTYLHGLVLQGEHRGKVVNLDIDRQKPGFTFEDNFLDWYERWLDEIISGELILDRPGWFGYAPPQAKKPPEIQHSPKKWFQFWK